MADRDTHDADRFDRYLEALLGEGRPSPEMVGDHGEAEMARLAAELAARGRAPTGTEPDAAFLEQLRLRMREADGAIASVRRSSPTQPAGARRWRLSRRDVLRAGIGAAAGLAAGVIGVSLRPRDVSPEDDVPLVAGEGFWTDVARVDEVTPGSALRFSTASFDGFVVNDGGTIRALSSVCTHMACTLQFRPAERDLRCPCHGASFDFAGRLANGPSSRNPDAWYRDGARPYPIDLPDLVRPRVKVENERILVWTAQA